MHLTPLPETFCHITMASGIRCNLARDPGKVALSCDVASWSTHNCGAHPKLVLNVTNSPTDVQVGEVIQAMTVEAGFDVSVQTGESVAQTQAAMRGDYQADLVIWSAGRTRTVI